MVTDSVAHLGVGEKMRALVCSAFGSPQVLAIGTLDAPQPGPEEVAIAVSNAGVSYVDTLVVADKHQNKHELPFAPGMEVGGRICAIGPRVEELKVGDKVMALVYDGAYANQAIAPMRECFKLPDEVAEETGAAMVGGYLTSHAALRWQGRVDAGETVLVLGAAGAVGLAAVQVAKAMGAQVIAGASTEERLALAKTYGADGTINYAVEDVYEATQTLTQGRGVDVVYDPVGGALYEPAFRTLGWGGRYLIIGFAGGKVPQFPGNRLLVKNRSAVGFALMHYRKRRTDLLRASADELLGWCAKGAISPHITQRITLEDVPGALDGLANREVVGKLVARI
ncbi:MAG: NADPH:quinone oxidoreductase family protein [Gammaproteobacteria bacterium]|nr:NADPH:quinone oxidoreductase family protein [Gammaproteobacteria bacterium]